MRLHSATVLLSSAAFVLSCTNSHSASAAQPTQFVCQNRGDIPTTIAQTQRGSVPVIQWKSDIFSGAGWTPQRRCEEVSARFQRFYEAGQLNYLTTGTVNEQPVVCVAARENGACADLLFTLRPDSQLSPGETLQRLMNVRVRQSSALNESPARVYINMRKFLQTAPVEGASRVNSGKVPEKVPSVRQPTSQSGNSTW